MRKENIIVDFDGVIHSNTSGYQGLMNIPDSVVEGAIAWIHDAQSIFTVNVFSSRSRSIFGRAKMKQMIGKWAERHFISLNHSLDDSKKLTKVFMSQLKFPRHKPPAIMSIDDRCFHFRGDFPVLDYIRAFKPWNKRG